MSKEVDTQSKSPAEQRRRWQIAATILVLAGMLPFVVNAYYIYRFDALLAAHPPRAAGDVAALMSMRLQFSLLSFLVYGAVILSFLGGVRWGVEIASRPHTPRGLVLVLSVMGSLAGWALVLIGVMIQADVRLFITFALIYGLHLVWDVGTPDLQPWFKRLRMIASVGAIGGMLAIAWLFA